jgi:hypothetical protein
MEITTEDIFENINYLELAEKIKRMLNSSDNNKEVVLRLLAKIFSFNVFIEINEWDEFFEVSNFRKYQN